MQIDTLEQLRALYPAPKERALKKQMAALDVHCRHFIGLSPFVVLASGGGGMPSDASPRGGAPGFVKAPDAHTLWIPDAPGNHRLDTLENIVRCGQLGLLFLIPGVDETLRVNGRARLTQDGGTLAAFAGTSHPPRLVIELTVEQAYLHCAKALMRSALWKPSAQVNRSVLPSMGEMLRSQTGGTAPAETQAEMLARYAADL